MWDVEQLIRDSLRKAQENGRPYVMFVHGSSTSRPGQTTARSVVRRFMRSKEATPFMVKAQCVRHPTVFVAKIRNNNQAGETSGKSVQPVMTDAALARWRALRDLQEGVKSTRRMVQERCKVRWRVSV